MNQKNIFSDLMPSDASGYAIGKKDTSQPKQAAEIRPPKNAAKKAKDTKEKPHHTGHRERLRQRFMKGGEQPLEDYELVEMLLFLGIPRKDVKPLAKDLLKQFKTFPALMAAEADDLLAVKGMTQNAVVAFKLVRAAASRMMQQDLIGKPVLNSWSRLTDYLYATMAEEKREHFRILFLDRKNNLLADEVQQTGTVDQTPAYPREIVKRALQLSATALILVHNHPSGDPSPSDADIKMTQQIEAAAKALEITLHDHVIISKNGYTSFKSEGYL